MSINNETSIRLRASTLEPWLAELGLTRFGVAKLERPLSIAYYDQWLADGRQGEMSYLERHRDIKADPTMWLPFARSAIVFAIPYVSDYVTDQSFAPRTALYARYAPEFEDYHHALRAKLQPALDGLIQRYPEASFRFALDAEPVLERDLAVRAGLGWVGKNTCIIDRAGGSLFFIAEILTSLETDDARIDASKDYCGTCTRCLDACPTQALLKPRVLDATKCISYWTIESKKIAPPELRSQFGDWFFGCDICQTVCPWNGKAFGREKMASEASPKEKTESEKSDLIRELDLILTASNRELQRRFEGTPLERARGFGLKRNALVVTGNLGLKELLPSVQKLKADKKLGTLALETEQLLVALVT